MAGQPYNNVCIECGYRWREVCPITVEDGVPTISPSERCPRCTEYHEARTTKALSKDYSDYPKMARWAKTTAA